MQDPVFYDSQQPGLAELLAAALDAIVKMEIPDELVDSLIGARLEFADDDGICQHEASGLVWGFVAGRYYADAQRLSPGYYSHLAHRQ